MCLFAYDLGFVVPEDLEVRDPADLKYRRVPVCGLAPGAVYDPGIFVTDSPALSRAASESRSRTAAWARGRCQGGAGRSRRRVLRGLPAAGRQRARLGGGGSLNRPGSDVIAVRQVPELQVRQLLAQGCGVVDRDAGESSSEDGGGLAAVSEYWRPSRARNLTSGGRDRRRPRESGRPAGRRSEHCSRPRGLQASRRSRRPQRRTRG